MLSPFKTVLCKMLWKKSLCRKLVWIYYKRASWHSQHILFITVQLQICLLSLGTWKELASWHLRLVENIRKRKWKERSEKKMQKILVRGRKDNEKIKIESVCCLFLFFKKKKQIFNWEKEDILLV